MPWILWGTYKYSARVFEEEVRYLIEFNIRACVDYVAWNIHWLYGIWKMNDNGLQLLEMWAESWLGKIFLFNVRWNIKLPILTQDQIEVTWLILYTHWMMTNNIWVASRYCDWLDNCDNEHDFFRNKLKFIFRKMICNTGVRLPKKVYVKQLN